jgi:hypothetical protein
MKEIYRAKQRKRNNNKYRRYRERQEERKLKVGKKDRRKYVYRRRKR